MRTRLKTTSGIAMSMGLVLLMLVQAMAIAAASEPLSEGPGADAQQPPSAEDDVGPDADPPLAAHGRPVMPCPR
jgi:hypothetical protein